MAEGTLVVALRVEQRAVRPASRLTILRIGMGPARAAAAVAALPPTGPVAVVGLGGGVAPQLSVGDVVVASEVRSADGRVWPCPTAPFLAGALRRLGLPTHVGPVMTVDRIAGGEELRALRESGVMCVDMESAAVAAAVDPGATGARPFAVVRVVSDTADAPLTRPAALAHGLQALRVLRRAAAVVDDWAAAAGPRDVLLASPRSFCAGVERAIDIVERALDRYGAPVYVRRQIVHNAHVVDRLRRRGAVFVDELDEVPAGARTVFAAHGVAPQVRRDAADRDLRVIDATCPLVAKVHSEVRRYAGRGDTVFLIGHRDHEEVVGSVGEAPDQVVVVDDAAEARTVEPPDPQRVAYVMQTTLAVDEAEHVAAILRDRFPALSAPRTDDICYATSNRQRAVEQVAAASDVVLVVGSPNSSNSRRLVEVAERAGAGGHLVDDATDVELRWLAGVRRVGVTAGASAPPELVDELLHCLAGLGPTDVVGRATVEETVTFTLPREVS